MALELVQSAENSVVMRPREKIQRFGIESLNDAELLSAFLGTGYRDLSVEQLSKHLLSEFGTRGLFQFKQLGDFQLATGLPFVKSCQILAISEYFRRLQGRDDTCLKSSEQFYDYIKDDFKRSSFEQLRVTCVDSQRRVLFTGLIAQGSSNKLSVTLASILHHPIRLNAHAFYLAHNHPEGDIKPSKEDVNFSMRLKKETQKFGLSFEDHLIVGKAGFFSFSLEGIM